MTHIDIDLIAHAINAEHYPGDAAVEAGFGFAEPHRISTGQVAEAIDSLIDNAAIAGAFADLADRTSIETHHLLGADGSETWMLFEFDRDSRLLRTPPVPVGELITWDVTGPAAITEVIGRVRHLLATAIVLSADDAMRAPALSVGRRHGVGRSLRLALTGPALDAAVMDAVKAVCVNTALDPNGPGHQLGAALAEMRDNPPSRAQVSGPEPVPDLSEQLWERFEDAENSIAAEIFPSSLHLRLDTAAALTASIIDAVAMAISGAPEVKPEDPIAVSCRKRREVCEDLIASALHAQAFAFEQARRLPDDRAPGLRQGIDAIVRVRARTTSFSPGVSRWSVAS